MKNLMSVNFQKIGKSFGLEKQLLIRAPFDISKKNQIHINFLVNL